MVHGLGGSSLNWMAVGPEIANSHHAIAIDLAGFGQTPLFRRSAAVGGNAELVHEFIEKVIGEPVAIMGNSMGGHIAVLEAAAHPAWVSEMILVDPAIPGDHVTRPEPARLGVMAALTVPGLAEILLDRRVRVLGPEGLVHETLALVCADPARVPMLSRRTYGSRARGPGSAPRTAAPSCRRAGRSAFAWPIHASGCRWRGCAPQL
jgi:pimeloyl-ACP methyl ester carboxylesterase